MNNHLRTMQNSEIRLCRHRYKPEITVAEKRKRILFFKTTVEGNSIQVAIFTIITGDFDKFLKKISKRKEGFEMPGRRKTPDDSIFSRHTENSTREF